MTFDPEIFNRFDQLRELPVRNVSKNCIACGIDNPEGLKMKFYTDGRYVCSRVFIPETKRGWDTIIHGGIISTIGDEIMAWGAICASRKIIFTRTMSITYRNPVFINSEVKTAAWVEEISDKEARMRAVVYNCDNILSAETSGLFTLMSGKLAAKMKMLSIESVNGFEEFIKML